jgi:hypothetical protein
MDGKHVGDNITGAQILQDIADVHGFRIFGPTLADVNQQRQLERVAEFARSLQRL